ncbi:MAG TPA: glycosyltransferase family 2 protein [Chloroflexota bacterium]
MSMQVVTGEVRRVELDAVDVTLVIPVYEEAESVTELYRQIDAALEPLNIKVQIVFVDDGSRDGTLGSLQRIFDTDPRVEVLSLRRNFGKTAALLAGFQRASGAIVITMDGDLQDDPKEIPRFLAALEDEKDLVSGWKRSRHDPFTKTAPSKVFNFVVRKATGIPLHDFNCGFKAYRLEVLDELKLYGELHRFIPVMAFWKGFRIGELEVEHHPRRFGRSKFGAGRLFKGMLDFLKVMFLTRYLQRPLQLFGILGLGVWLLGALGFLYILALKVEGQHVFQNHGPLLFLSGIAIISGIQLFMLGLVGEMLRHYAFRPTEEYSVKQALKHD